MASIFGVTFPFFALVLCGYLAARWRLLLLETIAGLNFLVLFFSLPCLLYRFGAQTPLAQLFDSAVVLVWLGVSRNPRIGWNDAAFPNSGLMGVPLLVALLGAFAAGLTILSMLLDMLVTTSLCIALSRLDGVDDHGLVKALKNALLGVPGNPCLGRSCSARRCRCWPSALVPTTGAWRGSSC